MIDSEYPIVECVINVSEGREMTLLNKIKSILHQPGYSYVLHMDIGFDANRTVFTVVGIIENLFSAIDRLVAFVEKTCDVYQHVGAHPYLGFLDVIPFIPLKNIETNELLGLVTSFAKGLGTKYGLPIYFYGDLTEDKSRKTLAQLRKGGLNNLKEKITTSLLPNAGPNKLHPTLGASCLTVRDFMAAFNININARDMTHAKALFHVLLSARKNKTTEGPLDLQHVRFLAWYMPHFKTFQISTNIYDIEAVDLLSLYQFVETKAEPLGISLQGAELIGMVPNRAICKQGIALQHALDYLNLGSVKYFSAQQNILENQLSRLKWG